MKKAKVSPEEFVRVFQESHSYREAAEKLGMLYQTVRGREKAYRAKGVRLKKMPKQTGSLDVAKLNTLADSIQNGKA